MSPAPKNIPTADVSKAPPGLSCQKAVRGARGTAVGVGEGAGARVGVRVGVGVGLGGGGGELVGWAPVGVGARA